MSDARTFQRHELALGVLALTAASVVFIVGMDAARFHAAALLRCLCHFRASEMPLEGWLLIALGVVDCVVIVRAARSALEQAVTHRAFVHALPVIREVEIDGCTVRVVADDTLQAFCAGLVGPAVYVSEGLLRHSTPGELRAIVLHETHHRARRDPLRGLLARVVSDAFRPLPPLATLAERHVALTELAADAAAVRALGTVQPLASALVRFDDMHAARGGGVAPERVDQLVGERPPDSVSAWLLAAAGLALAGIATLALPMVILGWHPAPALPIGLELAAIVVACAPACVAARRVGASVSPVA